MNTNVDALQPFYQYDYNDEGNPTVQPAIVRFTPSARMHTTAIFGDVPVTPSEYTHAAAATLVHATTAAGMVWQEIQFMNQSFMMFSSASGENTHIDTTRSTNLHSMTLPTITTTTTTTTPTMTALQLQLLRACEESASQPMLIMCENDNKESITTATPTTTSKTTETTTTGLVGASNASAIVTLAFDDDDDDYDDDGGGVDYNNKTEETNNKKMRHHAPPPPATTITAATTTSNTTIPSMSSATPLIQSSPSTAPVPFFNPGTIIHIAESRSPFDVLIGKSQTSKMHVGNVAFRAYVNSRLDHYKKSTRRGFRIAVCVSVTNAVFAAGGRFYAPLDRKCRGWEEANIDVARVKVGNSIRDSLKKAESRTNTAEYHKFSGSTSFTEIVNFFLHEMAVMDELNSARAFPRRSPSVVIGTTLPTQCEESRTDFVRAMSPVGGGYDSATSTTTTTTRVSSIQRPLYTLPIYSFAPRDGARVATLIKSTKKRKRGPITFHVAFR